jgi:hypothetical protein
VLPVPYEQHPSSHSSHWTLHTDAAKGKKKAIAFNPIQIQALKEVTDCLKFMTVWQDVAYMAAKMNLLPALVKLLDSPQLTLRHNAHLIIGVAFTLCCFCAGL